ncbi:MarR family winged helix-turn-helix transcriptional regulator [Pseudonocardia alni]|uniref:MarR family winged helix-turn-helix transcriptional regulator n=1 Tax=Pseudonocardia alni TaxID=33907 RepID=UPI00247A1B7B|nr:helix-turn-helix domain-containing protein [Pseudonocardia alni]
MEQQDGAGPTVNRWELSAYENRVFREYVSAMVFHGQVTADAAGLNATDLYALNLLDLIGEVTAGELARRTGLTTGAVTKLVDRLASAGLVSRRPDPQDRRRVRIGIVDTEADERLGSSGELFAPIASRLDRLISAYPEPERTILMRFFERATEELSSATREIQSTSRPPRPRH